ncbi:MAG: hypothetical protein LDLANPLL_00281 [Turneriella sp.]|nr:hypothetical protein [Turneriella sp.]
MLPVKVIHLIKRVEQIDREVNELHGLVDGIDENRSYRNTMKIAAEKKINDLVGERVKLMELTIGNPPEFLSKYAWPEDKKEPSQPRIALEQLLGSSNSTYEPMHYAEKERSAESQPKNSLKEFTRMMNVDEILPRAVADAHNKPRQKTQTKTRAEILRDLPPMQY